MTAAHHDTRQSLGVGLRRRLPVGAIVGYLVFTAGTLPVIWLAWSQRSHDEKPSLMLLIAWVVAGIAHSLVRNFWRACKFSALGSVFVYIVLVVFINAINEMFAAGMIVVGLFGYVLAMVMGIPVAIYRRQRDDRVREGRQTA
ncbi:MAG: hypothetical protein HY699_21405 [Deltaproteobacteria bacterium]|nr:hypothetical protein [Deltaproteobacteria bacterium]